MATQTAQTMYHVVPHFYIHVLDLTTNLTRVEVGPQTYIQQTNELVVLGPLAMVVVPPRHFCVVTNPVLRHSDGSVITDVTGQVKLRHADEEVRLTQNPFPLYPGETLSKPIKALPIVGANTALRLRALEDFDDTSGQSRVAGEEWLFEGPGYYIPRKEEQIGEWISATVIPPNHALRLRATRECVDRSGVARVTGEEWLVKQEGAYLPGPYEEVVDVVNAYVLTEKNALHLRARETYTDEFGKARRTGDEWLVTAANAETYIPSVSEEVVGEVKITTLSSRQYCIVVNPCNSAGHPQLGKMKLVKGEKSFFLMPGESLQNGVRDVYILDAEDGLILRANKAVKDGDVVRKPGERWMIRGPVEYVPPVFVEVVTTRRVIPLDVSEGIYVRNVKTGKVRAVTGRSYMLTEDEELWQKELRPLVEVLVNSTLDPVTHRNSRVQDHKDAGLTSRDKTRVITFLAPHNSAVQVFDFRIKKSRVVFGPELVMLNPDEDFTQLSMSGGRPKTPHQLRSLCLLLGPDYCTDSIVVETSDHARLSLLLAYNWHFDVGKSNPEHAASIFSVLWHFDVDKNNPEHAASIFSVPDLTGDMCNAMASRVRGAVAQITFDYFHKNSARIIRSSVFGVGEGGKIGKEFRFPQNRLVITDIDMKSVEPVDQRTRDALMKSVQMAIEITTNSQEAAAKHEAQRLDQEARGRLERQQLLDEAASEEARRGLVELQALSAAVESCGQAQSEAQSRAEAARIEAEAAVKQARLKAQAMTIDSVCELETLTKSRAAELKFTAEKDRLEVDKARDTADLESAKFKVMVQTIGTDTLTSIANAGPQMQIKMLQGLGLESTLITDGASPVNLFNTASGLVGGLLPAQRQFHDLDIQS